MEPTEKVYTSKFSNIEFLQIVGKYDNNKIWSAKENI